MERIEELLEKPCWIIDILPERVPEGSGGQYFAAEKLFLRDPALRQRQASFLLKLNCYYDFVLADAEGRENRNPDPETLLGLVGRESLNVIAGENALISADCTDTYMTLYNPDERMLALAEKIAAAEGLFVWRGNNLE